MATPEITIGVPVYRGERFLAETLASIAAQSFRDFKVLISLDGPQPAVEEMCRPFLRDARFRLAVQPQRLGWVANVNWLMSQADTEFWCFQGHDDLIEPEYLEVLVGEIRKWPRTAVVYSDLVGFGLHTWHCAQPSVTGEAFVRQIALLHDHHPAVAFRGLTRVAALRQLSGVPTNEADDFSCDTAWMSALARWGELRRVPGDLYLKRYHAENTHTKWLTWPPERLQWAWMVHCADMLHQAMLIDATAAERRLLWLTAVGRFAAPRHNFGYMPGSSSQPEHGPSLVLAFCDYVQRRGLDVAGWLDLDASALVPWTAAFLPRRPIPAAADMPLAAEERRHAG